MKVVLVKSPISRSARVKKTLKALGLRRINSFCEVSAKNKAHLGMVEKVKHWVKIDER